MGYGANWLCCDFRLLHYVMVDQLISAYTVLLLPMSGWIVFWYLLSLVLKRNDIVDIAWGLGFVYIAFWLSSDNQLNNYQYLVNGLVTFWGLRLATHLLIRNARKKEDWRYLNWRKEWGSTFYWRSFLQVYVLQTLLMMVIALPIVLAASTQVSLNLMVLPGAICWLIGLYWESVSDWQLMKFKRDKNNIGKFIQSGLWAKSRHPNYFGEICIWWGIWLVCAPYSFRWIALLSPTIITYLLLKVSGVPMLERKYKGNSLYDAYKAKVPAIWPKLK